MKLKKFKKLLIRLGELNLEVKNTESDDPLLCAINKTFNYRGTYLKDLAEQVNISNSSKSKEKKENREKKQYKHCWIEFKDIKKSNYILDDFADLGFQQMIGNSFLIDFSDGYSLAKHNIEDKIEGTAIFLKDFIIWVETDMKSIHDSLYYFLIDAHNHSLNSYFNFKLPPSVIFRKTK